MSAVTDTVATTVLLIDRGGRTVAVLPSMDRVQPWLDANPAYVRDGQSTYVCGTGHRVYIKGRW